MSDDQTRPLGENGGYAGAGSGAGPGPGGGDVLAGHEREPRNTPWWLIGGVAVVVAALVGGVTYGVQFLSGGGSQPEEALPDGAFAFAKVDLDPAAGQKIDAVRFLRKFPTLRDKVSADADLRKVLFEAVAADAGWDDIDYESEVEPWLGKRLAVAAYAPEGKTGQGDFQSFPAPRVVAALQVEDAEQARAGLERLADNTKGGNPPGFVVEGDYALLAETEGAAEKAARDAENGALAEQDTLASDLAGMDDGVAAVWVDNRAATEAFGAFPAMLVGGGAFGSGTGLGSSGRSTYVLRFDGPDVFEAVGTMTGSDELAKDIGSVKGFDELPAGTAVAFGLAEGETLLPDIWKSLRKSMDAGGGASGGPGFDEMVAQAEQELGIDLPDDLGVLLGSNLLAALGGEGLGDGEIDLGAKVTTDGERAMAVLDRIEAAATRAGGYDGSLVVRRATDDGYVIGSSKATLDKLEQPGTLGDNDAFDKALPDLDKAGFALWVDVAALDQGITGDVDKDVEPIDGVGVTMDLEGDGSATFRMRLVAH